MTHQLTVEELACLARCGSYDQYARMRNQFERGGCEFCTIDRAFNKVFYEDAWMFGWAVPEGFLHDRPLVQHLLVVPKRHIRFFFEMNPAEVMSFHAAVTCITEGSGYTGGAIVLREGSMLLNGGTVPHLHANIMQPDLTDAYSIPLAKSADHIARNKARAEEFSKEYEARFGEAM